MAFGIQFAILGEKYLCNSQLTCFLLETRTIQIWKNTDSGGFLNSFPLSIVHAFLPVLY